MIATEKPTPLVLLAEDSEDDAFFFQRAFKKAGTACSLSRAINGKAAIEILSSSAPVLLFLDLKMPVMSGFDVLEWLHAAPIETKPKVIVLSGSNDQSDRARAFSLGASDYLVKPITAQLLREKVISELAADKGVQV